MENLQIDDGPPVPVKNGFFVSKNKAIIIVLVTVVIFVGSILATFYGKTDTKVYITVPSTISTSGLPLTTPSSSSPSSNPSTTKPTTPSTTTTSKTLLPK